MSDMRKNVIDLIAKAAAAEKSDDAMRFSQAALNAANAATQARFIATPPPND